MSVSETAVKLSALTYQRLEELAGQFENLERFRKETERELSAICERQQRVARQRCGLLDYLLAVNEESDGKVNEELQRAKRLVQESLDQGFPPY